MAAAKVVWTYPGPSGLRERRGRTHELLLAAWAAGIFFGLLVAENQGGPLGGPTVASSIFAIGLCVLILATLWILVVRPSERVTGLGTSSEGVCVLTPKGVTTVPWKRILRLWWGPMDPVATYSDYRWNLSWTREGETWWGLRKTLGSNGRIDERSVILMIPSWARDFPKEIVSRPECPKTVLDEGSQGELRASGVPSAF